MAVFKIMVASFAIRLNVASRTSSWTSFISDLVWDKIVSTICLIVDYLLVISILGGVPSVARLTDTDPISLAFRFGTSFILSI